MRSLPRRLRTALAAAVALVILVGCTTATKPPVTSGPSGGHGGKTSTSTTAEPPECIKQTKGWDPYPPAKAGRTQSKQAAVQTVVTASEPCWDRMTITIGHGVEVGYAINWPPALMTDPSGEVVSLRGDLGLQVRIAASPSNVLGPVKGQIGGNRPVLNDAVFLGGTASTVFGLGVKLGPDGGYRRLNVVWEKDGDNWKIEVRLARF